MSTFKAVFLDFNLPNATTWFYFSFLLAIALFFKFSRFLSVRNWDVVTIFLLVPGLLILQEARRHSSVPSAAGKTAKHAGQVRRGQETRAEGDETRADRDGAEAALTFRGQDPRAERDAAKAAPATPRDHPAVAGAEEMDTNRALLLRYGYLWLLIGSGYFLVRCLVDLALERRPALSPNLTLGGLGWLSGALFICLVAVAVRNPPPNPSQPVGKTGAPLDLAQRPVVKLVEAQSPDGYGLDLDEATRFWVSRALAMLCHLAVVAGLIVIGARHFQDATSGMAAATFYLLLPYTGLYVGQLNHVWPIAFLIWAVVCYRFPALAGLLLGLAAGTAYFPALLFPIWVGFYWRRGAGRFTVLFVFSAALCLAVTAIMLWIEGDLEKRVQSALALSDWQPWKIPTTEGFWLGIPWVYRIPVFIAFLAFLVTTTLWPWPKNLAHVLALSAAVLVGMQFWYADQGGVYVLWYLPLLLLLIFRPNLSDRRPLPILPENDWLVRWGRGFSRVTTWLLHIPPPLSRVP